MKYAFVRLTYLVSSGLSSQAFDFEAQDVLAVPADSPFLADDESKKALIRELLASSTRGGGISHAHYSGIRADITIAKDFKKHPGHLERGASYYTASLGAVGQTVSDALMQITADKSFKPLDAQSFKERFSDVRASENRLKAVKTRYTGAQELAKYKKRHQRAVDALDRLMSDSSKPYEAILKSKKYKEVAKRAKEALKKIEHITQKRDEYALRLDALKTQKARLEQAAKAYKSALDERVKTAVEATRKSASAYERGQGQQPAYYGLTRAQIEEKERQKLDKELAKKPVYEKDLDLDDRVEREIEQAKVKSGWRPKGG